MARSAAVDALLTPSTRTRVMGVVNVTPDSFSDGGQWFEPAAAVAHGRKLLREGADLLDIGGESTRPGAQRVSIDDELARVLPVIDALAREGALISIDTTRAEVARQAIAHGAVLVNDVSGGLANPEIREVVAAHQVPYVIMHWRGHADVMDSLDVYDDVVSQVRAELNQRISEARSAGIGQENIILDPGLGFAKAGESNWPLLANLPVLTSLGYPVLVGASRKRFLGHLLAAPGQEPVAPEERDAASAAISALAALNGAWAVRVHSVRPSVDAVKVAQRWRDANDSQRTTNLT